MRKAKKIISLMLAVTMLFGVFASVSFAAPPRMTKDTLDIEAESANVTINGTMDVLYDPGIRNTGNGEKPKDGEEGGINFEFRAVEDGDYEIWVLANPMSENKVMYVSINKQPYEQVRFFAVKDAYYYTKLGTVSAKEKEDVSVSISAMVGWYTIDKFTIVKAGTELKNPDGSIAGDESIIEKINAEKEANKKYAEKIPTLEITGNGNVYDMSELGLSEWWSDKVVGGINAKHITQGSNDTPDKDARGDLEFEISASANDTYNVWIYVNPTSVSKSAWISTSADKAYGSKGVVAGEASKWQWVNVASVNINSGEKALFRLIPKNSSYTVSKVAVLKGGNVMPEGDDGKIAEKKFDTSVIYPTPPVVPQKGVHPRVMFTAEDIPQIKENMAYEGNAGALVRYNEYLKSTTDGKLPAATSGTNYNGEILNIIQCRAFEYAINGDEAMGRSAVDSLRNYVNTLVFNYAESEAYNQFGEVEYVIGCVYDWCYKFLTEEDKILFRDKVIEYASNKIGYPPNKLGSVTSHGNEGPLFRDLLAPAIAMYDEYPSIYENAAGRLYADYVPAKNFLYPSHMGAMQGAKYMSYREKWTCYALYLMDAIGAPNVFGDDMEHITKWLMYARLPDGDLLKDGDNNEEPYYTSYLVYPDLQMMLANYYENPYMKWEYLRQQNEVVPRFSTNQSINCTTMFIVNKKMDTKPVYSWPLSYYFNSPKGAYIARTSWDEGYNSPTVVAEFKINEYWTSNHQHLDAGAFQIYYKGSLAVDSGYYKAINDTNEGGSNYSSEHWKGYYTRSIAHNTMLVKDPDEKLPANYSVNDGGQEQKNNRSEAGSLSVLLSEEADMNVGKVLGHEIGIDTYAPNYTYLKGDLTNAYTDKVEDYQRSFMFLNLKNDEHPAALLVFDHVTSSKPEFEKSFVLNTVYEPEVNGTRLVAKDERVFDAANKYNGKLTMDTLLPAADNVEYKTFVGMDKYAYSGDTKVYATSIAHADGDGPRTEISPKTPAKEDYFLNVIQVGDADGAEALTTTLVESNTHYGAVVADRVVMFGKTKDKVSGEVSFTVANEGEFEFTVTDLAAGTWSVAKDGTQIGEAKVTEEGTVATFNGSNGTYTLTKVSNDASKQFTNNVPAEWEYIGIRINGRFLYSDVPAFIENGRTLVPLRAIFEGVGAEVSWDADTATATGTKDGTTVQITEGSNIAKVNGNDVTLDVAANTYDGRFMVPVRFIAESLGATVKWRAEAQIVDIEADVKEYIPLRGKIYSNELSIISAESSPEATEATAQISMSLDGNIGTYWGAEGTDGQKAWGIYDLGASYSLDKVYIGFHNGVKRTSTFAIDVSEDGVNYTTVIEKATSSGTTFNLEPYDLGGVKGRYIKFRGFGNSTGVWNSITEIRVTEKK